MNEKCINIQKHSLVFVFNLQIQLYPIVENVIINSTIIQYINFYWIVGVQFNETKFL